MYRVNSQSPAKALGQRPAGAEFTLAHASDLHLSSPSGAPAWMLANKRLLGYLSWLRRRRWEHRPEVVAALVSDLGRMRPDHVVVTGDLTHVGLPMEYRQVRDWLAGVRVARDLTLVPGNHDAYVRARGAQTLALWEPYMASDSPRRDPFPILRVRGPMALLGLSSACPSAPLFATGRVGAQQLRRLGDALDSAAGRGLLRIVLLHHPPTSGVVGWRKRLRDAQALREVLLAHGAELILHGHAHRASFTWLDTASGRTPVIGVPSGSSTAADTRHRARYNLYRFRARAHGQWRLEIEVRGYRSAVREFVRESATSHTLDHPFARPSLSPASPC